MKETRRDRRIRKFDERHRAPSYPPVLWRGKIWLYPDGARLSVDGRRAWKPPENDAAAVALQKNYLSCRIAALDQKVAQCAELLASEDCIDPWGDDMKLRIARLECKFAEDRLRTLENTNRPILF